MGDISRHGGAGPCSSSATLSEDKGPKISPPSTDTRAQSSSASTKVTA
ncbi:hypothetical protein [Sphingopyxis sp. BSNA05]|nr:hypothetical protein [Sphingopyxis sp. BSNA05]